MQIGLILSELMRSADLTMEAVAERVRAQGATNVRYQHIQQLLEFPNRRPRYLPELARAFGMSVEEFLAYSPGKPFRVNESPAPPYTSQQLRIDSPTLAASHKLVRLACDMLGVNFEPEEPDDAELVLLACTYLQARSERAVTPDNVVDFTKVLRKMRGRGDATEGNEGAGRPGRSAGAESKASNVG